MHDLVIRDALIVDGTGAAPRVGDIAIDQDRIVHIGTVRRDGVREIVARGAVAAPGFIDTHSHDDWLAFSPAGFEPKICQGVTTVVTGNCGLSLAPVAHHRRPPAPITLLGPPQAFRYTDFGHYLSDMAASRPGLNILPLIGHTSLRAYVMDDLNRSASDREVERMLLLLTEALHSGAAGLSTGLYYPSAQHASADEIEFLLRRVGELGGIYTAHVRDEGDGLFEALDEALDAARGADVPLVVSHVKCAAPRVWGHSSKLLRRLEDASQRQELAFDVYPYDASSTMLNPARLKSAKRVVVSWSEPHPEQAGQDLAEIARCWCCSYEEAAARLSPGGAIYYKMEERDVRRIVAHPLSMIGSDGLPHDHHPHPRLWGTFPRVLGRYVRELGLLTLPDAVRKMTSLPAAVFGLADRGVLREGAFADVTLFDQESVLDTATFEAPRQKPDGIHAVIVNGTLAWSQGSGTGQRNGRLLSRSRSTSARRPSLTRVGLSHAPV